MYDSRTDRAGTESWDKPWHYRSNTGWGDPRKIHKFAKRTRSKKLRRDWNLLVNKSRTYSMLTD